MIDIAGKLVVVVGCGGSGIAAARLAAAKGARVLVVDGASSEKLGQRLEALAAANIPVQCNCQRYTGEAPTLAVVSPGVPADSPLLQSCCGKETIVCGELGFAAGYAPWPLYAITGTNGKTTSVELLNACLNAAGRRSVACGNIGRPLADVILENPPLDCAVVEVSSFQLEFPGWLQIHAAAILNVTPDHLNRHGTMECYRQVKMGVLQRLIPGGCGVYHQLLKEFAIVPPGCRRAQLCLSGEEWHSDESPAADKWVVTAEGVALARAGQPQLQLVWPRQDLQLQGDHNLANVAAVLAMLDAIGIAPSDCAQTLKSFQSGPHRIQKVASFKGVEYIDDSKSTDVDAMRQALRTVGKKGAQTIHLIAGGVDKGCTLEDSKNEMTMYVKAAYLIGSCRQRLFGLWSRDFPCVQCESLEEAVGAAAANAAAGETVLLSPACASQDMFRDYAQRGRCFAAAVQALIDAAGSDAAMG